jgi:hypothetical protein
MLFERKKNITSEGVREAFHGKDSAGATALKCDSEKKLRTPCYCEENVWRLAYRRLKAGGDGNDIGGKENEEYYVAFISNVERRCPMLYQVASESPSKPVFWDYHVILIRSSKVVKRGKSVVQAQVLDMDSNLPYPSDLKAYLDASFDFEFRDEEEQKIYEPVFRVIRAELYLQNFYSDRMHMKKKDGSWMAKPPLYDCITTPDMVKDANGNFSNLEEYLLMKHKGKDAKMMGELYTLKELRAKFGS